MPDRSADELFEQFDIWHERTTEYAMIFFWNRLNEAGNSLPRFGIDDLLHYLNVARPGRQGADFTAADVQTLYQFAINRDEGRNNGLSEQFRPIVEIFRGRQTLSPVNDIPEELRMTHYTRAQVTSMLRSYYRILVGNFEDSSTTPSVNEFEQRKGQTFTAEEVYEKLFTVFPTGRIEDSPSPSSDDQLSLKSLSPSPPPKTEPQEPLPEIKPGESLNAYWTYAAHLFLGHVKGR